MYKLMYKALYINKPAWYKIIMVYVIFSGKKIALFSFYFYINRRKEGFFCRKLFIRQMNALTFFLITSYTSNNYY